MMRFLYAVTHTLAWVLRPTVTFWYRVKNTDAVSLALFSAGAAANVNINDIIVQIDNTYVLKAGYDAVLSAFRFARTPAAL